MARPAYSKEDSNRRGAGFYTNSQAKRVKCSRRKSAISLSPREVFGRKSDFSEFSFFAPPTIIMFLRVEESFLTVPRCHGREIFPRGARSRFDPFLNTSSKNNPRAFKFFGLVSGRKRGLTDHLVY